jgi:hypothetical protein
MESYMAKNKRHFDLNKLGFTKHSIDRVKEDYSVYCSYEDECAVLEDPKAFLRQLAKTSERKLGSVFGRFTYRSNDWFLCIKEDTVITVMHKESDRRQYNRTSNPNRYS